jgi:titin
VTTIGGYAFSSNALTSAVFEGNYGDFDLFMFGFNPALATITYCNGTTGWPQGFNNGSTIVVTEPVNCSAFGLSAPQITSIEPGNAQVFISVSVADDGGSPITGYTAYCFGDTLSFGTSPTSPITVSGLTNGEAYECLVTATNDIGTSPLSAASAPVIPAAFPPSAPQITGIEAGNAQVFISVSVADDGGSPITGYTATCLGDGIFFGTSPTSPITVSGLTNGEAYECLVTATNDIGTSPLSAASALITPVAPPPGC